MTTYLVTGASGHLGRLAVLALLERGIAPSDVVATARDTDALSDLAARGVVTRRADYTDPASLEEAFAGSTASCSSPPAPWASGSPSTPTSSTQPWRRASSCWRTPASPAPTRPRWRWPTSTAGPRSCWPPPGCPSCCCATPGTSRTTPARRPPPSSTAPSSVLPATAGSARRPAPTSPRPPLPPWWPTTRPVASTSWVATPRSPSTEYAAALAAASGTEVAYRDLLGRGLHGRPRRRRAARAVRRRPRRLRPRPGAAASCCTDSGDLAAPHRPADHDARERDPRRAGLTSRPRDGGGISSRGAHPKPARRSARLRPRRRRRCSRVCAGVAATTGPAAPPASGGSPHKADADSVLAISIDGISAAALRKLGPQAAAQPAPLHARRGLDDSTRAPSAR